MAVQFHVMQSSGKLSGAVYDRLERVLKETYDACSQKLKFADIRFALCSLFASRGNQGCVLPWR